MDMKPKIVIIHPNSLCCLAMRTILTDIAPFMGMLSDVDILTYNSMEEFLEHSYPAVVHYFVEAETAAANLSYFESYARRCILLMEGEHIQLEGFRAIDVHKPERELLKSFLSLHSGAHSAHIHHAPKSKHQPELLSQREKEVLALIVKGYINKEIADQLNISTPTVIFHRKNIVEKIGSKSIGRLTIYAVMNGIVDFKEL